ncbi:jerky protein homolog [Ylistrum balloti]|uniref:jerky protein homolog n=1 Tax=Ylistrum balloti TaxID=509963 RepID=UPI002905D51C|nr:jerky protein homolog [Ylistrum balloti]
MIEKAKELGKQLDITDFAYLRGWIQRFKERRGMRKRKYHGEVDSADMTSVQTGRHDLRQLLTDYNPEDIYNMDETELFYRLGPNYTLATETTKGTKKSKDRITVALTANATGTHKFKPFVIANFQTAN